MRGLLLVALLLLPPAGQARRTPTVGGRVSLALPPAVADRPGGVVEWVGGTVLDTVWPVGGR